VEHGARGEHIAATSNQAPHFSAVKITVFFSFQTKPDNIFYEKKNVFYIVSSNFCATKSFFTHCAARYDRSLCQIL
jgi:hypothetical protein